MKTKQKKLQTSSKYNEYDLDGDGVVSDAELANMKEIKETETALRKNLAQLRMARYTLIAMGLFTFMMFMPFISIERINALAEISSLFYISGAGIVGAYMGTTAWMNKKEKRDPKVGTGKKPKGSGRRLYTDENPRDTVSIKFATPADARATVSKVKKINKPYARKIQILTVGEQRAKVMGKSQVASIFKKGKEAIRKAKKVK